MNKNKLLTDAVILVVFLLACSVSYAESTYFSNWPDGLSPQQVGSRIATTFLQRQHMLHPDNNTIHYAEVLTWYGGLDFAAQSHDKELIAQLVKRAEPLWSDQRNLIPPANHVDFNVFGVLPLQLYVLTADIRYRTLGLAFADAQWDRPRADGLTAQTRYWVDDMYMITALQTAAYRATGDMKYLDRSADEMVDYLKRLQQSNGLFHHSQEAPIFWGRGNGWYAAGMAQLLRSLPAQHRHRKTIMTGYKKMMAALLRYQSDTGLWRQVLDHRDAWFETSSSAMFAFAFVTGVDQGWLDANNYGPAARRAWLALASYVNENGELREVCVGTGAKNDLQYYLDRPRAVGDLHGQAPMLWAAAALLRAENKH